MTVGDRPSDRRSNEDAGPAPAMVREPSPEEVTRVLKQRAERLARPGEPPSRWDQTLELVLCRLGGALYGIDTAQVVEIVPWGDVTRVPCTPSFVLGVIHYRGRVLAVVDLRALWDGAASLLGSETEARVVVVAVAGLTFGLGVDGVTEVVQVDAHALAPVVPAGNAPRPAFVRAMTKEGAAVLDLDVLCQSGRIVVNDST